MSRRRISADDNTTHIRKIQEQTRLERKMLRKKRRRRFLRRLFMFFIVISIAVGIYLFDQSKYSKLREIQIVGNKYIDSEVILDAYGFKEGERLVTSFYKEKFKKVTLKGVANIDIKLYYTKGLITLTVKESPLVAYSYEAKTKVLLEDNSYIDTSHIDIKEVPLLVGFSDEMIKQHPKFSDKLARMSKTAFNGISEIHIEPEPLEDIYFKLFMNNGYFVYTNLDNLLLMDYYPEIISKLDDKDNRCIYFLDDGRTDENQSAVAKKCE